MIVDLILAAGESGKEMRALLSFSFISRTAFDFVSDSDGTSNDDAPTSNAKAADRSASAFDSKNFDESPAVDDESPSIFRSNAPWSLRRVSFSSIAI